MRLTALEDEQYRKLEPALRALGWLFVGIEASTDGLTWSAQRGAMRRDASSAEELLDEVRRYEGVAKIDARRQHPEIRTGLAVTPDENSATTTMRRRSGERT